LFHLYMKWNGRCFSIDIPFNPVTKNYSLGPVERNSVVDLINFYITNQLPVREDIGAILFSPVVVPQSGSIDESEICTPTVDGAGHKEYGVSDPVNFFIEVLISHENLLAAPNAFSGLNSGRSLGLSQYASTPPTEPKLDRKRIRYLPMSGKPSQYRNVNLNKSLGNLTSIYCDPSNFSGSTLSLPTTSFTDLTHKDTTSQRLTKMCQGFVNYNLTLPFLTFDDVPKPLDEDAFISIGKVLLNAKADTVATCLAMETASILTLNWLPIPGDDITLPSDGYSLLLWPAANGYRRDLFNR
uniref:Rho-GAP domain-containing protein n=1 Tax=Taenia asiatica TaxID=60517 RepID=A0A0R3VZF3_TAEAS